jgi:hypothetical protein
MLSIEDFERTLAFGDDYLTTLRPCAELAQYLL